MAYIDDLKLKFPLDYIAFTRGYTSSHFGADLGWNSNYGGQNVSVYAPADGTIVAIQENRNNDVPNGGWGNYLKIDHGNGVYTLSAHLLKGSINALGLKVGQKVVRGQQIGKMNNSGNSNGSHVHFEVYYGGAGTSYRVDPLKYCYVYPDQAVSSGSALRDQIKYYNSAPTVPIGKPVDRDKSKWQVEVLISDLRARLRPEKNDSVILGYIVPGIYDVLDEKDLLDEQSNGELWIKVEHSNNPDNPKEGVWIAVTKSEWATIYAIGWDPDLPPESADKDKQIAELKNKIVILETNDHIAKTAFAEIKKIIDAVL